MMKALPAKMKPYKDKNKKTISKLIFRNRAKT